MCQDGGEGEGDGGDSDSDLCYTSPAGPIPVPTGTHTHKCGYGFYMGMGTGQGRVTHGLPVDRTVICLGTDMTISAYYFGILTLLCTHFGVYN